MVLTKKIITRVKLCFLFLIFTVGLDAQTAVQFEEGPWAVIEKESIDVDSEEVEKLEQTLSRKEFRFWCGEEMIGTWQLTKVELPKFSITTYKTENDQGPGIDKSEFSSDTLAMMDIFREVRQTCPQAKELKRRPTEHIDFALFIIQNFFLPFPEDKEIEEVLDKVLKVADEMPRFPGCEDMDGTVNEKKACADKEMLKFVYSHQRYPKEARDAGIQGTVVVTFIIETDGYVNEPRVIRDIGGGCGYEALRIVQLMQDLEMVWEPGKQDGLPVRVRFNLPVKFRSH